MFLKAFYRKKIVVIYLIIYVLLFLIFSVLIDTRNKYIMKENDYHKFSYILIDNISNVDLFSIKNISNVVKTYQVNCYELFNSELLTLQNDYLKGNEVVLPLEFSEKVSVGDKISIIYNGKEFNLLVKDFDEILVKKIFVSKDILNSLFNNSSNNLYLIYLKNWLDFDKTWDELLSLKMDLSFFNGTEAGSKDYKNIFNVINAFFLLFLLGFAIVGFLTILNIINDEKKNIKLYKVIGYNYFINIGLLIIKIISLIVISFAINVILFLILKITLL